jgi:hypothetical protein
MDETSREFKEIQEKFNKRTVELWEAFQNESIRVMLLVMAAEVDRLLGELLKRFIKEERVKKDDNKLFRGFGPMATFFARTELAYRLGLISKEDADGMDALRDIRNDCAHEIKEFSLEKEPFKSKFNRFADITMKRDNFGVLLFGAVCPKSEEELVFFTCVPYIVKQELTLVKLEKTPDRFFQR